MTEYSVFDVKNQQERRISLFDNGDGTYTMLAGVSIDPGDISIGAVEIKDADGATRVRVQAANAGGSSATPVMMVQPVDASGQVLDSIATFTTQYLVRTEDASASVTYIGNALPGTATSSPAWQVLRLTDSGSDLALEYANGATTFDEAWDDRATITYS